MRATVFSFLLCACFVQIAHAQQPTALYNGKTVFVYPYQHEVSIPLRNFKMGLKKEEGLTRDSLNRTIVSTEIRDIKRLVPMDKSKSFRKNKALFMKIRSEHPGILYNYNIAPEEDIVPALEPLKDGNYVQYYRDLPYVKDDILRWRNDVVCAVFTLKNNQLDGFACWLTAEGDTLKAGNFRNGLKEGAWIYKKYEYNPEDEDLKLALFLDGTYKDTSITEMSYVNGLSDGPYRNLYNSFLLETGFYKNGNESGEWREYSRKTIIQGIKTIYLNEPVMIRHYSFPEQPVKAKGVIVRNKILDLSDVNRLQYNLPYESYFYSFDSFYTLYKEKEEEGLELPEEKTNSYPGEEMDGSSEDQIIKGSVYDYEDYSGHEREVWINGKKYTRNDLIDSLGYIFKYEGIYEEFYNNGQLKLRFEVRDGKLVKEDTIFWNNGSPVNVITYDAEAKEYTERTFDYDGKEIKQLVYDEKGNFLRIVGKKLKLNEYLVNGKIYKASTYDAFFNYSNNDTLVYSLFHPVVTEEALWRFDTTIATMSTFDPLSRTYESVGYSLDKVLTYHKRVEFGEDYSNLLGTESYKVGKVELFTHFNGSYDVNPLYRRAGDSVLSSRVQYWERNYDIDYDNVLNYDGRPFSGKFTMTTNQIDFALDASYDKINFRFANGAKHSKKVMKSFDKYVHKQKSTKLTPYMNQRVVYNEEASTTVLYSVLPFINYVYTPVSGSHFREYDYKKGVETVRTISEKKAKAFDKTIDGQFLNGKPEGLWITRDQFGEVTSEAPFKNGELDGEIRYYKTAYPQPEDEFEYGPQNPLLRDSLPAKPVHYLARVSHLSRNVLNGTVVELDWMGDTLSKLNYVDGRREGPSFDRSKLAYTTSGYENGSVDGITRTYLTVPGRDTILLFDLNFQNGALQGESKSYHLNGKMAKHGFFLSGEPIDDFEAFDTLGFRYQYVKFQYSQPIEEKIWEENELSVRYTFDWRDSIYFNTRDIAGSTSLDRMLSELGLDEENNRMPYYGRPSLVSKTGIDYHMTKYYPNDTVARDGAISSGKKVGCWQFYGYEGNKLYEVDYFDTIITVLDSVRFKSKGILTYVNSKGEPLSHSYIVEKFEKYDCAHTDHYEVRMLVAFWEKDSTVHRMNGHVKNYYDNGVLQNEGWVKDGIATGVWKFYDPYGSLNQVGEYTSGKRQGRWLSGDLSQVKYMGDICLNPNLQNLDEIMSYQEKLLDISVVYYQNGSVKKREYYGVNMNSTAPPENYGDGEMYYEGEYYEGDYYDEGNF